MDESERSKAALTHPITEMFVYITVDDIEGEAIMLVKGRDGWYPMIGSDMKRALSLRPLAETIAERYGKRIRLVRFADRKDVTKMHAPKLHAGRGNWTDPTEKKKR